MRVVDEARGQERVEQRLDARGGRGRIEQRAPLLRDHVLVRERIERAQRDERLEPQRRQPRGLDRRQVPATALHVQHVDRAPEQILSVRLHGSIATAVQHELRVRTDQARRVHTQREQLAASRVPSAELHSVRVAPAALHSSEASRAPID